MKRNTALCHFYPLCSLQKPPAEVLIINVILLVALSARASEVSKWCRVIKADMLRVSCWRCWNRCGWQCACQSWPFASLWLGSVALWLWHCEIVNANVSEVIVAESGDKRRFHCVVLHGLAWRGINNRGGSASLPSTRIRNSVRFDELNVYKHT